MSRAGVTLPAEGEYGVGMVFCARERSRMACQEEIERAVRAEGQILLGWRDVPVDNSVLGDSVKQSEPVIRQIFIGRGPDVLVTDALERKLYIIRKRSGHAIQRLHLKHGKEFYVPSFSARTLVYKVCSLRPGRQFLSGPAGSPRRLGAGSGASAVSTNTFPTWDLSHPFRFIAHNGEINTLRGNVNGYAPARRGFPRQCWAQIAESLALIYDGQSDSASFDNALELLVMGGYSLAHAMMLMIPEAWEKHALMDENRRAFYEYHAAMMEPWTARRGGVHRRPPDRRHAGQKRSAAGALPGD